MSASAMRARAATQREFIFSDKQFDRLRQFVTAQTGIVLVDAKKDMVYSRLSKHIRHHFNGSFEDFCQTITDADPQQCEYLINAITTNLTAFFREQHHFDYLRCVVIPQLVKKQAQSRRIRIWSAGCSSGEEAYSIAMCLRDEIADIDEWDIKILATDLDANVLQRAAAGIYYAERINVIEFAYRKRWFYSGTGPNAGLVKVHPALRDMIQFRRLNLLHDWPMKGPFDVIFCRNVVIYFEKATQRDLFERYANLMAPAGYLFIGHSESLHQISQRFVSLGNTIYQRREP